MERLYKERYPSVFNELCKTLECLNGRPISLDIDAVTQATYVRMLNDASHRLGKSINREDLTTYWGIAEIAKKNGVSPDESLKFAIGVWNNDPLYLKAPVMPGITDLLRLFDEMEISHVFISSRPVEFEEVTKKWFKEKFPWIDSEKIILGRKDGMSGGEFKSRMVKEYGVALHIEDSSEEAQAIVENTGAGVLIVPHPWNEEEKSFKHPKIKYLGDFRKSNGTWPVLKFLISSEARDFLSSVAQCH